jgi:hypothetical protein
MTFARVALEPNESLRVNQPLILVKSEALLGVVDVLRCKATRQEIMKLKDTTWAMFIRHDDGQIMFELEEHLPTCAAWRNRILVHGQHKDRSEFRVASGDSAAYGDAFGTYTHGIGGVLYINPSVYIFWSTEQSCRHRIIGVGSIGIGQDRFGRFKKKCYLVGA